MFGIAPDKRGLLPDLDVRQLEEFGASIRERYAMNLIAKRTHP
jgi:alpha-L-fucosidase